MDTIVLDIETTGLSPYRHGITEIAAVKLRDGEVIDEFHTMVNPGHPIPSFIRRFTGITDDMVKDAPHIKDVLPHLHEFMSGAVFVGHNVGFDHKFLDFYSRKHLGKSLENELLCTCKLARRLLPDLPSKRLGAVCEHFAVENRQAHRAMHDVLATTEILKRFQEQANLTVSHLLSLQKIARRNVPEFLEQVS